MANFSYSFLKYFLNCRSFSFGKCVRLRRHSLNLEPKTVSFTCSCRRMQISTAWRTKQNNDFLGEEMKQRTIGKDPDIQRKMVEIKEQADENIPLIVKVINQSKEHTMQKQNERMSIQKLQKTLEDIKWDTDASVRKLNVVGLEEAEEEIQDDEADEHTKDLSNMTSIEDVYLDDEVPQPRTVRQQTKKKQKIKGTPDPSIPASDIPCSGCGAALHCQDPVIPGYMPSEKFKCLTRDDMRTSMCQRCFLIQAYNMFLSVRVSAETYPQILKEIRDTQALVIVVIDLFDMKNSVFNNLLKHIGTQRPLFIVGNKVDLIPKDSRGYLQRTRQTLLDMCNSAGLNPTGKNIKHIALVSAKTGYGIESLVTKLMTVWQLKGHVFVVGSTNAGKSTLFNALLMSDYCKAVARGFINRATVSVWPGTTLNLLKFPIINPAPWRLLLRSKRLHKDEKEYVAAEQLRRSHLKDLGSYRADLLTGHVGLTDFRSAKTIVEDQAEAERLSSVQDFISFSYGKEGIVKEAPRQDLSKGVKSQGYRPEGFRMYWCNDTPGVVNPEQIINLLEPEELVTILPKTQVLPQCVVIQPGQVLFVTGLGRIDYVQGNTSIYLTAHVARTVKLHVKDMREADEFYLSNLGTASLGIPIGDEERLSKIPSLTGREFLITGTQWDTAAADIQLSSVGWVSVAAGAGMSVTLRAYTPGGRGLHLRCPALLPNYKCFKGKRKGKTPFYRPAHFRE